MTALTNLVGWVERTRETHRTLAWHTVGHAGTLDPPYNGISCTVG
jgi:tRNA U55 pseudouridine synthase TruB